MEPRKLYTSSGIGFPPEGCKHGEGVGVGKSGKNTLYIHITFLKTDQILRKITLGSIKACIITNFLRSFFDTWTALTFPKILAGGTMNIDNEYRCSERLVCPGFLGSPHSKAHTLPSSKSSHLPLSLSVTHLSLLCPFPTQCFTVLSLNSMSPPPGNCWSSSSCYNILQGTYIFVSQTQGQEHPEGWTWVISTNTQLLLCKSRHPLAPPGSLPFLHS